MLPERARALPEGGLARMMASRCLRLYWHMIFDPCPRLIEHHPPDGKEVFEPFLAWCDQHGVSMDWSLHLHLLAFLVEGARADLLGDRDLVVELLAAAASRWTRNDLTSDQGILMGGTSLPGEGVLAWKCASLTEPKQVLLVRMDPASPPATPAAWICLPTREDPPAQALDRGWTYRLG